jgi:hypothetical protein
MNDVILSNAKDLLFSDVHPQTKSTEKTRTPNARLPERQVHFLIFAAVASTSKAFCGSGTLYAAL